MAHETYPRFMASELALSGLDPLPKLEPTLELAEFGQQHFVSLTTSASHRRRALGEAVVWVLRRHYLINLSFSTGSACMITVLPNFPVVCLTFEA